MRRLKLLSLLSCIIFVSSCTPWEILRTTHTVVEAYPEDNCLEEHFVEPAIEDYFDLPEDSVDLSFWNGEDGCGCEE